MREQFTSQQFNRERRGLIDHSNNILAPYAAGNLRVTARQLYYRFIALDLLPESWRDRETRSKNTMKNYKKFAALIADARDAGLIDWNWIEDRGRDVVYASHWNTPADILRAAAQQFRLDVWKGQGVHVEVMVEKDALSGVLEPVCAGLDVRLSANKGYSSSSAMYEAGQRIAWALDEDNPEYVEKVVMFYLGDHDPSGVQMTDDIERRIRQYSRNDDDEQLEIIRLALNMDQVRRWNPPENAVKHTDSRWRAYARLYGEDCWELDAIEANDLAELVRRAVTGQIRDVELWNLTRDQQQGYREELLDYAGRFEGGRRRRRRS